MKTILALLTLITVAVLTGCAHTEIGPKFPAASPGFTPKRVYEGNLDKIYSAINRTLDEKHIAVVWSDKSAGRMRTEHIQGTTMQSALTPYVLGFAGNEYYRYSYNIGCNEDGLNKIKVTIIGKLERSVETTGIWSGGGNVVTSPYADITQGNRGFVGGLENWLYEEIEKKL